jgi:hypothetical protein
MWKPNFKPKPKPKVKWPIQAKAAWHDHEDNCVWAKAMLFGLRGQRLQAYLLDGLLATRFYPGDKLTQEQAAMEYARLMGYLECFARLQETAVAPLKTPEDIPLDYDQTKPPEEPEV